MFYLRKLQASYRAHHLRQPRTPRISGRDDDDDTKRTHHDGELQHETSRDVAIPPPSRYHQHRVKSTIRAGEMTGGRISDAKSKGEKIGNKQYIMGEM